MDRSNPYEAAFEAYLQSRRLCYVAVDESKRALWGETPVKNLDFIVLGAAGARLLVDVKGRRFPGGPAQKPRYVWENWSTQQDIDGLANWMRLFGDGYLAVFVFLYRLEPTVEIPAETADVWVWREHRYLLRAVPLPEYRRHMRVRSPRWGTVGLPGQVFRDLARPFRYFSHAYEPAQEDAFHGPDEDWRVPEGLRRALATCPGAGAASRR